MNKVYLLVSFLLLTVLVINTYDGSEVMTYTDGVLTLRVHCDSQGAVLKREYLVEGVVRRVVEYEQDNVKVATIYDEYGNKLLVNKYANSTLVKSVNYNNGIYAGTNELAIDPIIEI